MDEYTGLFARIAPSIVKEQRALVFTQPLDGVKMDIDVGGRSVEVWYHRTDNSNAPVLFEMHSGGFALNDAAKNDAFRQWLCDYGGFHVVGINYRKTPKHPYPQALFDVLDVIRWFGQHAGSFGMDRDAFFVCGQSAGANLAAVASNLLNRDGRENIKGQILHYPFLDLSTPVKPHYPTDLAEEVVRAFIELYCDEGQRSDPCVSPLFADSAALAKVAPALIITAECDTIKTSAGHYADRLRKAGVYTSEIEMPGVHHGYIEDWFNPDCYNLVPENERTHHTPDFGAYAVRAAAETISFIDNILRNRG